MKTSNLLKTTALSAAVWLLVAPHAHACGTPSIGAVPSANSMFVLKGALAGRLRVSPRLSANPQAAGGLQIVGMWNLTFYVGSTTDVWDQAIQQFYADGNEMTNDIAVSPAMQNVCWGVWEQAGGHTFKLKHLGWNFDMSGNLTGMFVLTATIAVDDPEGNTYTGSYVADSYDLSNNVIPEAHGEGVIKGTRVLVD